MSSTNSFASESKTSISLAAPRSIDIFDNNFFGFGAETRTEFKSFLFLFTCSC